MVAGNTFAYAYDPEFDNSNGRTIQGFSTGAKAQMYDCQTCPYLDYEKFVSYYGQFDYADRWVTAALTGTNTDFDNGNANFGQYGLEGRAGKLIDRISFALLLLRISITFLT